MRQPQNNELRGGKRGRKERRKKKRVWEGARKDRGRMKAIYGSLIKKLSCFSVEWQILYSRIPGEGE
jgi:hypothetical protein